MLNQEQGDQPEVTGIKQVISSKVQLKQRSGNGEEREYFKRNHSHDITSGVSEKERL